MKVNTVDGVIIVEKNRFSGFVRRGCKGEARHMAELERWVVWFKSRGIAAAIACGANGCAVYREGLEELPEEV